MPIRTKHQITDNTWFITFTCFNWIPLFQIAQSYDLVYKWFKLSEQKYHLKIMAFVIMPNHVHLILELTDKAVNLNIIISNAKRFMAFEMIQRLTREGDVSMLDRLSAACSESEKAKGQLHKVFEPSFDAKPVYTFDFLNQKIDYIHYNPLSGKWNLADDYTKYTHSSAAFYETGRQHKQVNVTDVEIIGSKIINNSSQGPLQETLRGLEEQISGIN